MLFLSKIVSNFVRIKVKILKKKMVRTFYVKYSKKNKKYLKLINMISKLQKLIQAHNSYDLNWEIYIIFHKIQKIDLVKFVFIVK